MLLATALVASSCSNEEGMENRGDSSLSAIELGTASNTVTRAGFTEAQTTLKLHYVSTKREPALTDKNVRTGTLYMTSSATAEVDATKNTFSVVTQTTGSDGEKRYWDDIHGKNSLLALYAVAVPNKLSVSKNASAFNAWDTKRKEGTSEAVANTIAWTVSTTQDLTSIADEDLAYSDNVKGLGFNTSTNVFDKAEGDKSLVFKHALSRFTVNVIKGDGFGDFATSFKVTSLKFTGFNVSGTLNVEEGTFTSLSDAVIEAKGSQTKYPAEGSQTGYTFKAQMFPGTAMKNVAETMLSIVVDGNVYNIKGDDIYKSLLTNNSDKEEDIASLKQGKNYNLTVRITKTAIEIAAAQLLDWDEIKGHEMTPSNAIALTAAMEKTAGETDKLVASDLYRSTSQESGYTDDGNQTTLAADGKTMGTTWYWPDNSTSYFLRTVSPCGTPVSGSPNVITMSGGAIAVANDYIWGAPLKELHGDGDEHTFDYDNGYDKYLYPAIGATDSEIHITQFHMMSNLQVNLITSEGGDKVNLTDATVEILDFYNTATLALGNAAITAKGGKTTSMTMVAGENNTYTFRAIPQSTSGVTLRITAAGNVYNVKLPADTNIAKWLPGKSYVYTFKIVKTEIKVTSARLVDWQTVTATDKTVTLE